MPYDFTEGAGATAAADEVGSASNPASGELVPFVALASGTLGALELVTATNPTFTRITDGTDACGIGNGNDLWVGNGGSATASIASAAANTVVKASAGRLCRALVTTAGSGTGNVLIYDNATTDSGTVIGIIPATIAIGTYYTFDLPAANGITVKNVASGPVLTVSYF